MKSNFTPKLILLAFVNLMLFSCSVNEDDQPVATKKIDPSIEVQAKSQDSTFVQPGEPLIPKPKD
ncbi:MAG TPA: hypothetical protein VF676_09670 [Flavobacterium sp.]|jgi:hypothetical protein